MSRKPWLALTVLAAAAAWTAQASEALMNPSALTAQAPETFRVQFATTKGDFVVEVNRTWAPLGSDRFYNLVTNGFYDDVGLFRVVEGFVVQFGINGDPHVNQVWRSAGIKDDEVKQSNTRGTITFATSGKDSRTTQVFINTKDNARLDGMGFAPFGRIVSGIEVVDQFYKAYGEAPSSAQGRIQAEGNEFLKKQFPNLDYVKTAKVVPAPAAK